MLSKNSRQRNRRRGLTLIELLFSMSLIGLVITLGSQVSDSARGAFVSTSSASQIEARLRTALDRVAMHIENASAATFDPALTGAFNDSSTLSMQSVTDIVGGALVLGNVEIITYQNDPADPVDNVDNDGDGLVDEGRLVLIRNAGTPNPRTVVICKNVRRFLEGEEAIGGDDNGNGLAEEAGFLILRDGNLLTIQLTLEESGSNGEMITRTSSTSVMLRN